MSCGRYGHVGSEHYVIPYENVRIVHYGQIEISIDVIAEVTESSAFPAFLTVLRLVFHRSANIVLRRAFFRIWSSRTSFLFC